MKLKPYWAFPTIEKVGLTRCVSSTPLQPREKILEVKRQAADKACSEILRKDSKVEIVALLGSVANGDIIGWFSDIDLIAITDKPKNEEMIEVDHQVLFIEYHNWASFKDLMVRKISREEYEVRSSYLFFYGNPRFLYASAKSRTKYEEIVTQGIQRLWKDHAQIDKYLDDFVWFYGTAREASRYDQPLTALGKLQRGTTLLLRYYLVKNKILLRKPLPDDRTITQLRSSPVPKELVNFIEQLYQGKLNIDTLLKKAKEMYLQITNKRKMAQQNSIVKEINTQSLLVSNRVRENFKSR
jgi:predicted nucleotidyltransferase